MVDATGDGDVAVLAHENYSLGDAETGKKQPSSAMFEMSDVDTERVRRYVLDNPQEFEWKSDIIPMREFDERLRQEYFVAQGFKSLVQKAEEKHELSFGRDSVLILNGIHPGSIHFNATRIAGLDETDTEQRTEAEIDGRRQIESVSEFMIRYVPGFEHAYVSVTNSEIGVRESRHIEGVYTLTGEDVYNGRKFEDVASRGYFPIDMHNPDGVSGRLLDSAKGFLRHSLPMLCPEAHRRACPFRPEYLGDKQGARLLQNAGRNHGDRAGLRRGRGALRLKRDPAP